MSNEEKSVVGHIIIVDVDFPTNKEKIYALKRVIKELEDEDSDLNSFPIFRHNTKEEVAMMKENELKKIVIDSMTKNITYFFNGSALDYLLYNIPIHCPNKDIADVCHFVLDFKNARFVDDAIKVLENF